MDLLESLCRDKGVTLVVVSHDPNVAHRADRTIQMLDGRIVPRDAATDGAEGTEARSR